MRRLLILLFPLLASTASAGLLDIHGKPIDEYNLLVEGRYWFASLSGEASSDQGSFSGSDVDFNDQLNLDDWEGTIEGLLQIRLKGLVARASYFQAKWQNQDRLEETFNFEGSTYTASDVINSEVDLRYGAIDVHYLFLDVGSQAKIGIDAGLGVGVRYIFVHGDISDEAGGFSHGESQTVYVPVVGISASVGALNLVSLDGTASIFRVTWNGIHGTFIDGAIELKFYLHHAVYVSAGYRYVSVNVDVQIHDHFSFEGRLDGFFVGAGLQF